MITFVCFYLIYTRVEKAAERDGLSATEYLVNFFTGADWISWLLIMIPYSVYFFLIDSHATWRLIRWFNTSDIKFTNMLPIRASAYILSRVNEQVGKGAMAVYLNRRDGVPGWEVGSSMLFIMFCEFYYLLAWAVVGAPTGCTYGSTACIPWLTAVLKNTTPSVITIRVKPMPMP